MHIDPRPFTLSIASLLLLIPVLPIRAQECSFTETRTDPALPHVESPILFALVGLPAQTQSRRRKRGME
jgi:hypothetical protein